MKPIDVQAVQAALNRFVGDDVYLHLETTNGAYAAHRFGQPMAVCAYIRNGRVRFERAAIAGNRPYRVGLKMEQGWIYAEGLTDYEVDEKGRLLLAGHDDEGRLAVALQLSRTPWPMSALEEEA
ncbi:YojF family protein [Alicyclobacillus sendaiensis]|uniref:YojF family protein n=1 Tax=Alicyclobacillus sendaiensis PA2 TaxID=3029425 RepID=A0ABT6XU54_ALISE|nr:YojF family protein [Alicyclobacillus sendaiensis]MDI9258628.1 YojF family protein [Alicyclobacillus sendaiensis PA2]